MIRSERKQHPPRRGSGRRRQPKGRRNVLPANQFRNLDSRPHNTGSVAAPYHWLRVPSVWHDEAVLIINVIEKNFFQLLGSLSHHEAGPPLFLWAERLSFLMFGDGATGLRLLPFLASCLALILFASLCERIMPQRRVLWAVALFAFSDRLVYHACEAKPYAFDICLAVCFAYLYVRTREWPLTRQLCLWLPLAPIAIWVSYPGCFLCGGLLIALLPRVAQGVASGEWRVASKDKEGAESKQKPTFSSLATRHSPLATSLYAVLVLAVGASFLALATGPAKAGKKDGAMASCWVMHFVDWSKPWSIPSWVILATMGVVRYCTFPVIGHFFFFFAAFGGWLMWQRGDRRLLLFFTAPIGLALVAAGLHAYPYGPARVMAYAAPAVIALIALSIAHLYWTPRGHDHASRRQGF